MKRLEDNIDSMVNDIDKKYLRPIQRDTYLNMSKCFDSNDDNKNIEKCIERNNYTSKMANNILSSHLNDFQSKLQRCVLTCEDNVSDSYINSIFSNESENRQRCIKQCADKHYKKINEYKTKLETDLSQLDSSFK